VQTGSAERSCLIPQEYIHNLGRAEEEEEEEEDDDGIVLELKHKEKEKKRKRRHYPNSTQSKRYAGYVSPFVVYLSRSISCRRAGAPPKRDNTQSRQLSGLF